MTDISINGIKATAFSHDAACEIAASVWDAGHVEYIGTTYASEYVKRMLTAAAETALWSDTEHEDDREGTGEYASEVDDLRFGYSPDYEDALPDDAREELESDVENFVRGAWLLLTADGVSPEDAGHNFQLSRNGHGSGFWDRGYRHGEDLHAMAQTFGTFGLMVAGHDEDIKVIGHHN